MVSRHLLHGAAHMPMNMVCTTYGARSATVEAPYPPDLKSYHSLDFFLNQSRTYPLNTLHEVIAPAYGAPANSTARPWLNDLSPDASVLECVRPRDVAPPCDGTTCGTATMQRARFNPYRVRPPVHDDKPRDYFALAWAPNDRFDVPEQVPPDVTIVYPRNVTEDTVVTFYAPYLYEDRNAFSYRRPSVPRAAVHTFTSGDTLHVPPNVLCTLAEDAKDGVRHSYPAGDHNVTSGLPVACLTAYHMGSGSGSEGNHIWTIVGLLIAVLLVLSAPASYIYIKRKRAAEVTTALPDAHYERV